MKGNFDESNNRTTSIISDNLGKYGFRLDSVNNKLKKIQDSAKTKVYIGEDPVLVLRDDQASKGIAFLSHTDGAYNYSIQAYSNDAGSSNYKIRCSIVVLDSFKNYQYIKKAQLLNEQVSIPKDMALTAYLSVPDVFRYAYLFVWFRGKYKTVDGSKEFDIDQVYYNNRNGNVFGMIQGEGRGDVIEVVNKAEGL